MVAARRIVVIVRDAYPAALIPRQQLAAQATGQVSDTQPVRVSAKADRSDRR